MKHLWKWRGEASAFKLQHNWVKLNHVKSSVNYIFYSVTKQSADRQTDRRSLSWSQTTHVTLRFGSYQHALISVQNMTLVQHLFSRFNAWVGFVNSPQVTCTSSSPPLVAEASEYEASYQAEPNISHAAGSVPSSTSTFDSLRLWERRLLLPSALRGILRSGLNQGLYFTRTITDQSQQREPVGKRNILHAKPRPKVLSRPVLHFSDTLCPHKDFARKKLKKRKEFCWFTVEGGRTAPLPAGKKWESIVKTRTDSDSQSSQGRWYLALYSSQCVIIVLFP